MIDYKIENRVNKVLRIITDYQNKVLDTEFFISQLLNINKLKTGYSIQNLNFKMID